MKLNEVANASFDDKTAKNMARIAKAVKKEMNRFGKNKIEITPYSYLSGEISVEFEQFMHPGDIGDAYGEFIDAIKRADTDGHIAKIEDGNGSGVNFVSALLSGLKPGMTIKSEAFFPTLAYGITWKNIQSKK